jgi:hypothetical protein
MWYDPAHNIDSTERVPVNRTCDSAHTLCVGHLLYVYTIYDSAHTETILGRPAPKSYAATIFLYGVTGAIGTCVLCMWPFAHVHQYKGFSRSESTRFQRNYIFVSSFMPWQSYACSIALQAFM